MSHALRLGLSTLSSRLEDVYSSELSRVTPRVFLPNLQQFLAAAVTMPKRSEHNGIRAKINLCRKPPAPDSGDLRPGALGCHHLHLYGVAIEMSGESCCVRIGTGPVKSLT